MSALQSKMETLVAALLSDGTTTPETAFDRAMELVNAELDIMMRETGEFRDPFAIAEAAAERALARLQPADPAKLH